MKWGLQDSNGAFLPPRRFSDGKTQIEVVNEILEEFESYSTVLLKGVVGSGKSPMGIHVAGAMGRGLINVPVKPLQDQYMADYEGRLRVVLDDGPLRINVVKGRFNFRCPYMARKRRHLRCSSKELLCTIPIDRETPRHKVAKRCPFWSPVYPYKVDSLDCDTFKYESIGGTQFFHRREKGCGYYDQFENYLRSDILVFNNAKWYFETLMKRKPKADIEVFDEADLFLDSLTMKTFLSVRKVDMLLKEAKTVRDSLVKEDAGKGTRILRMAENFKRSFSSFLEKRKDNTPYDFDEDADLILKALINLLKTLDTDLSNSILLEMKRILEYKDMVSYYIDWFNPKVTFFIPQPEIILKEFLSNSAEKTLFMSATLQSEDVLKNIFGLEDFGFVVGETKQPGKLYVKRVGREKTVTYPNWKRDGFKEEYWKTLSKIIVTSKRPTLVQVHSFKYLPDDKRYPDIPSRKAILENNQEEELRSFVAGGKNLIFSTKTDRGIDLPDDTCRSIVLTKYPFPDLKDPVLRVMKKRMKDEPFWRYYRDIAKREFYQQMGRGLRSESDWLEVWSPDLKVHEELQKSGRG
ncbi:MAG: helicase C-terminal domain-containing protein [Candidatus Hydrothermarchaeales archaeon]